MQYVDFNIIANYFKNKIENVVYNLQYEGELPADEVDPNTGKVKDKRYKFVFYVNKGDYHKAVIEANAAKDRKHPEIPVLIKNDGGVQDPNTPMEIYLQKIEFEIYGWCDRLDPYKDQWHDVELIFSRLCSQLKGTTDILNNEIDYIPDMNATVEPGEDYPNLNLTKYSGHTIKLDIDDYPTFQELENKHFLAFLNTTMIIMFNAHLSNLDKIRINGVEIPYMNFTENFEQELIPDNKITSEIKFMPNVYTYVLNINGLYVKNNSVVNNIVNEATDGNLFGQPFGVDIIRDGVVLASRTMYVKNFQSIRSFGSIVAYNVSFYPAYTGV